VNFLLRHGSLPLLAATCLVVGCGGAESTSGADGSAGTTASTVATASTATIIDVRTPEEFADGHIPGALNLSLEDGSLESELGSLDPAASYLVYCRSGRRSAIAVELMASEGFTDVTDLGGLEEAVAATGSQLVAP